MKRLTMPKILALDFDGVICNGLWEYFQTTQRTYQKIWTKDSQDNFEAFADAFYRLRPVIETGWEMPILLRALVLGYQSSAIEENWHHICSEIITQETLDQKQVMAQLDEVRDHWIKTDLEGWLKLHRFYPGVLERLRKIDRSSTQLYIVTTKEGRFVKQLLKQEDLEFPESNILGKEVKQPKYESLRQILQNNDEAPNHLWFIEDLLKTLKGVQTQTDLTEVKLFLADWGYNTEKTHRLVKNEPRFHLLSLVQFSQDFSDWIE